MSLEPLLRERQILICAGPGGVGKTTTAAALALGAARAGLRVLVMTIDPARRLADSLGLERLDHEERRVPDERIGLQRGGSLHAMMLDQRRTFDELVERHLSNSSARERLGRNRIYQQVSERLSGAHEYAATVKLSAIAEQGRYQLIVVDTPPAQNALDFFEAPDKLVGGIRSPALDWLAKLYRQPTVRLAGWGGGLVLKRLARFVGSRFLEDMAEFAGENAAVIQGLGEEAEAAQRLMRQASVAFVLVCSPRAASIDEALALRARLEALRMSAGAVVCNRVHQPESAAPRREELLELLYARPELRGMAAEEVVRIAADLDRTHRDFQVLADIDAREIERLRDSIGGLPFVQTPLLDRDVYDLAGLTEISRYLLVG